MKILFLTQWCQPEPFFKGIPFAKALQSKGHEVEILTGFPNYPGGKLYPGYKIRLFQREIIDGIPVNRVALYPSHDQSGFHRILNYMSFAFSAAFIGQFLVKKPDVIYVYNLITLDLAAQLLKKRYNCPVIYDIQDIWPDSVSDSGMIKPSALLKLLSWWCQSVYSRASHIITLSPGFKKELMKRGVPEKNISVIYNWADESNRILSKDDEKNIPDFRDKNDFIVMFAGTMGVMQGLDSVLDAAEKLMCIAPCIKFIFIGGGIERERLKINAVDRSLHNVVFLERQPPEKINAILQKADVLLVTLKDTPLFRITVPSKIQAYMANGKPILLGVHGDSADIIRKSKGGIVVKPEDPDSIAQGVLKLCEMSEEERRLMGDNAKKYYQEYLSMDAGVRNFERIFYNSLKYYKIYR